jgi:NDP-sugar pyrophosphorylase family protein
VLTDAVAVEPAGEIFDSAAAAGFGGDIELEGPVLLGEGVKVGEGARLDGPLVIGPGAQIGAGARLRESVLLPGAEIPADGLLAGAIAGSARALAGIAAADSRP